MMSDLKAQEDIIIQAIFYTLWSTLINPKDITLVNRHDMLSWLLYKWEKIWDIKVVRTQREIQYTYYPNAYATSLHNAIPNPKI